MVSAQLQRLLPQHALSRWISRLSHCRIRWFKNWAIDRYIRKYQVNLEEAISAEHQHYSNLNAFFTRQLKTGCRHVDMAANSIVSPADGRIQQCGHVSAEGQLFAIKGEGYSLEKLLANQTELSQTFQHAAFFSIYLSPKDYHRVHMPVNGRLRAMWTVPGKLFAVNPQTVRAIPDIFARNERVICLFDTDFGPMCVIMVGAMIVSGIVTTWAGRQTPSENRHLQHFDYRAKNVTLNKGDEMGYFEFGSTVVVLMANGQQCQWQPSLAADHALQYGQNIGIHQ